MSPSMGEMWRYDRELIAGPWNTSVSLRLGELPPYPCLQSILRLERSSIPTRGIQSVSEALVSDVEYICWDAYDKMAPVENRKGIRYDHYCPLDGPGIVRNHAFDIQHRGNDRCEGSQPVDGQPNLINVHPAALGIPGMELFEDLSPGYCSSNNHCIAESSKVRQAEVYAEPFAEPEMPSQPEENPMSHEALMLEVDKITTGMEMIEARCVDIGLPEYDAAIEEHFSEALTISDRRSHAFSGLQEKPSYNRYDFSMNTSSLANTSILETTSGSPKTPQTCEPSIASNFGDLGVVLAFTIVQFFERPTNTKKRPTIAAEVRKTNLLTNDCWQSVISMHNRLLQERHDFFLGFNHPAASPALKKLAAKYFGTLSAIEESWIKCLGDLGYCRVAMDEDESASRKLWRDVARSRYNKAADGSPRSGRPSVYDCSKYSPEKLGDCLEAHNSTTSIPETDRIRAVELRTPRTNRIGNGPLPVAQVEQIDQHPFLPAAVTFKDLDDSKGHTSVNFLPLAPIISDYKDLERNKDCITVYTEYLDLSPRRLSNYRAYPPNTPMSTLPPPVPCNKLKQALCINRLKPFYRCIRPCHVLIALGFFTIVGSLGPAIWRSTNQNDISGGFSLGQYILGAGVFVIGSIVVIHSKTCVCWV